MKLSELIAAYGDDKVQFQKLDESADRMNMNGGITKITFGTDQPLDLNGTVQLGLVIWMDRDRVKQIIADAKATAARSRMEAEQG
jgi:hypothetical protein